MADVFGTIGNDQVELNNAATEATLRQLLQTTIAMAKGNKDEINKIAQRAGLDPQAVAAANQGLSRSARSGIALGEALAANKEQLKELGQRFVAGTAEASNVFDALKLLPGPLGVLAGGIAMVARYQEENLKTYQQISSIGANFGGSLTQMRQAATNTYMTLEQFGAVVSRNGDAMSKLGGGVNQGVQSFAQLSKTLLSSSAGRELLALGFTTEQVNEGMLNYISMTGGRTRAELATADGVKKVAAASAEYLEQLNALADLTGESREKQQQELAEASKNAAFQSYLQGLDEDSRKKAMAGMANALAVGGKGAVDAFQSKLMGVAPDKAGQLFIATASKTAEVIDKSATAVADKNKKVSDMNAYVAEGFRAAQGDMSKFSRETLFKIIQQGGPLADTFQRMGITANKAATMTDEDIKKALEKANLEKTEAERMTEANASLKEFTQGITGIIGPIVSLLTPAITFVAQIFGKIGNVLGSIENPILKTVASIGILGGAIAALILMKKKEAAASLIPGTGGAAGGGGALAGIGRGAGGALTGIAGGLASLANPATLIGLAAVTLAVMGLAKAFEIASPGFEKLADGMVKLKDADPLKLLGLIPVLGGLAAVFLPFSITGGLAALSINTLAEGLAKMSTVDADKLERVAAAMEKVNAATPSVGTSLRAGFAGIVQKITGGAAETPPATPTIAGTGSGSDILSSEIKQLNTVSAEMLKFIKETADYSRRNYEATKQLSGNLFPV